MIKIRLIFGLAIVALSLGPTMAVQAQGNSNAHNKVTICHATGSKSNPYVRNSPNANGVRNGHSSHQDKRDGLPPYSYNDHGTNRSASAQNWNSQTNDCTPASASSNGSGSNNNQGGQVLARTAVARQQTSQVVAPTGAAAAGAGGGAGNPATAVTGLAGSLLSLGAGLVWLNRRGLPKS